MKKMREHVRLWRGGSCILAAAGLILLSLKAGNAKATLTLDQRVANLEATVATLQATVSSQANQLTALQASQQNEIAARQTGDASLQQQISNIPGNPFTTAQTSTLQDLSATISVNGGDVGFNGSVSVSNAFAVTGTTTLHETWINPFHTTSDFQGTVHFWP